MWLRSLLTHLPSVPTVPLKKQLVCIPKRLKTAQLVEKPFRYVNEQQQYLSLIIRNTNPPKDWAEVKSMVLAKRGDMNIKNINAVIIKSLITASNYDQALSFIAYIKSNEGELGLGTSNAILKLYALLGQENKLSKKEIDFIRETHKSLYKKYGILDVATSESLVKALAVIGDWKNCLTILQDIKVASCPSHSAYSTVIATLFKHDEKAEAIALVSQSLQDNRPLLDYVYEHWMDYITRNHADVNDILTELEEMNVYISHNCVRISKKIADKMCNVYTSHTKWCGNHTEVSASGKCHSCKTTLDCIKLSQDEFSMLQSSFKERVLVGRDVFLKTSPEELAEFVNFLEKAAPYDIVLDALNIAYAIGPSSSLEKVKFLKAVVTHFLAKRKKILLLGRQHVLKWPKHDLNFILYNTKHFFTNNLSQDDPFFLTAALFSGPKTDFLSRDKLRGHRFLLKDDKLRSIFLRWQWEHQWVYHVRNRNLPSVSPPLSFTPCAQRAAGWHVPYELDSSTFHTDPMNAASPVPAQWLCLQPPRDK